MPTEVERAVESYENARRAEKRNEFNAAEIGYLKSANLFQQLGEMHFIDAAIALNALAFLREARGDHHAALCSAKHAETIMDAQEPETSGLEAQRIHLQTWALIGYLYRKMKRDEEAEKILRKALEYARIKFGEEDDATVSACHHLAILYKNASGYEKAEALCRALHFQRYTN